MRQPKLYAAALLASFATVSFASDGEKGRIVQSPPVLQAVFDCRAVSDPKARFACYDQTVEGLEKASAARDIVVVERSTVKEAQKGIFGLSLPKIKLFDGDDNDQIKEIESAISNFRRDENGALIITLMDGARWRQIDDQPQIAKVGDKIKIRKTGLGSFFANINSRSGFKVTRLTN